MKDQLKLNNPQDARRHNIIDMGLGFSAMIRLFAEDSKKKLRARLLTDIQKIIEAESERHFKDIHASFCDWGTSNIMLAKRPDPASYGQIAKTLDVVLKVAVYYCHLPNCEKSQEMSGWLNAAMDVKMMADLKKRCPKDIRSWPATIKQVDRSAYMEIQKIVRERIREDHKGSITPVQYDDIYWEALNRQADPVRV